MNTSINENLRNKDKENKIKLNLIINGENKYKDKYIKKNIFKKKNSLISSERKKSSNNNNIHYKYVTKKSQSMSKFSTSNLLYRPLGPYSNVLNGGGGFCSRISNNNNSQIEQKQLKSNRIKKDYLNKFINKNSNVISKNNSLSQFKIKKPYNSQINSYGEKNKNKYKTNYINYINNKNKKNSRFNINPVLNINEVNRNIKYFKLNNPKIKNDNIPIEDKNKKNYKNIQKKVFSEEYNIICTNEHFSFDKKPIKSKDIKKFLLIKQSNEQFSMNNFRKKAFNQLCEIENIILSYYPTLNNNKNNTQNIVNSHSYLTNCSICSNQAEYSIIKETFPKKNIMQKDNNKNVIININQISQISPKIKIIQKDDKKEGIINKKEEKQTKNKDFNEENDTKKPIFNDENDEKYEEKISNLDDEIIKNLKKNQNIQPFEQNESNKKGLSEIMNKSIEFNNKINNNINEDIKLESNTNQTNDKNHNENESKYNNTNIYYHIEKPNNINEFNFKSKSSIDIEKELEKNIQKIDDNINDKNNKNESKNEKEINKDKEIIKNDKNNENKEQKYKDEGELKKIMKIKKSDNIEEKKPRSLSNDTNTDKNKEKELKNEDKRSKQFLRFKARLAKKVGTELKKEGDKYHVSSNIIKMASKLEEQISKPIEEKRVRFVKIKSEPEIIDNVFDILDRKPVSLHKKKSSKIIFHNDEK